MGDFRKDADFQLLQESNSRKILKCDSVVDAVIDSFVDRAQIGKAKYNTSLDREDLSLYEWLEHAQNELQDAILYLEKVKRVIGGKGKN